MKVELYHHINLVIVPATFKTPIIFLYVFIIVPIADNGSMHADVKDLVYGQLIEAELPIWHNIRE